MDTDTMNAMDPAQVATPLLRADPWVLTGPLLVATDGTGSDEGAFRVAEVIAQEHGLSVHAVSVVEPVASMWAPVDGLLAALPPVLSDGTRTQMRLTAVRDRVRNAVRTGSQWQITARVGPLASTIVAAAREIDASLIIMGLGRHRPVDRLLGNEVAAQVVRRSAIPVLAVPSDAKAALRRTVVGVDFSRASIRAARAAVSLTTPPGHVWLAHVKAPLEIPSESYEGVSVVYTQGVLSTFKKIQERLEAVDLLEVRPVVLEGSVADELLAFAASHRADLIVTGAHGRTLVERLLIGSVTTKMLRAAQCAVLVIPPYRADLSAQR
jgi:nucleotide-binding universal stress UspA family protein